MSAVGLVEGEAAAAEDWAAAAAAEGWVAESGARRQVAARGKRRRWCRSAAGTAGAKCGDVQSADYLAAMAAAEHLVKAKAETAPAAEAGSGVAGSAAADQAAREMEAVEGLVAVDWAVETAAAGLAVAGSAAVG